MIKLAKSFGISDVGLRKKCKKLNIPLPPQGYWVKKQFGKTTPRPPLPPFNGNNKVEFAVNTEKKSPSDKEETEEVKAQIAFEQLAENKIHVPDRLNSPHPLIARFKESLHDVQQYEMDRGDLISKGGELLDIKVSRASMDRVLRLMDTIIEALEARGYRVKVSLDDSQAGARIYKTAASVLNETIAFGIREGYTQKRHEPEQDPKKRAAAVSSVSCP
jgi:hypothetical protein